MNATAIALARNDADVIEAFVRHHLDLVDLLVVIDNASIDGTREILEALRQEGLPLMIVDDPALHVPASAKLTRLYRMVAPVFNPELVYFLEPGQFVRARDRASLEAQLSALPCGATAVLRRLNYIPGTDTVVKATLDEPLARIVERQAEDVPGEFHTVLRRDPADDAQLVVDGIGQAMRRGDDRLPSYRTEDITLACFPVRSAAQLTARLLHGWQVHKARQFGLSGARKTFPGRALLDQVLAGRELSAEDVAICACQESQGTARRDTAPGKLVRDPLRRDSANLQRYRHLAHVDAVADMASGLRWPGPPEVSAPLTTAEAMDLAPVLDLCASLSAGRAIVMASSPWSQAIRQARPGLALHVPQPDDGGTPIDLLFVPDAAVDFAGELASVSDPASIKRIAFWPAARRTEGALAAELAQWHACGWEPDMMRTMVFRALSSHALCRHGAMVMRPVDAARAGQADAVRQALIAIDAGPSTWIDPATSLIHHPLQMAGAPPVAPGAPGAPVSACRPVARLAPPPGPQPGPIPSAPTPQPLAPKAAVALPAPTAIAARRPRSVLILGAGRSGTSCLAGMFGAQTHRHARDLYAPQLSNPKGFFEAAHINDLNESILLMSSIAHVGADGTRALLQGFEPHQLWLARFPDAMQARWNDTHRREVAKALEETPFCLKDPRMSITAPAWLEQAPDALVLSIHRAPDANAESVLRECRTATYLLDFRISAKDAFAVWRQAYRRIVVLYRSGVDVLFLRYGDLFDPERLARLEGHVGGPLVRDFADRALDRTAPCLVVDRECQALHGLLEALADLSFNGQRAQACALIDRHFAEWPDRPEPPGIAALGAKAAATA